MVVYALSWIPFGGVGDVDEGCLFVKYLMMAAKQDEQMKTEGKQKGGGVEEGVMIVGRRRDQLGANLGIYWWKGDF